MTFSRSSIAVAALLFGCSSGTASKASFVFAKNWQDDGGRSISAIEQRLAGKKAPVGPALALGLGDSGLIALGLDGTAKWTYSGAVDARPAIAGNVVVATGGNELVALEAKTGKRLWKLPAEGRALVGAGDDGELTVASLSSANGNALIAVDRSGSVVRKLELAEAIGEPAVLGGIAFVPWGEKYVSAVDLRAGGEIGRLFLRDRVSHAIACGGDLWFGQSSLVRFDDKIGKAAANQATRVALPHRDLPGDPLWFEENSTVLSPSASARDRIRLYARPTPAKRLDSDRYAATYFRIVMGLDAKDGALRWVRSFRDDVIAGSAAEGGFALCDAGGAVHVVAASNGGDAGDVSLGQKLRSCVVQTGALRVGAGADPGSLVKQIGNALDVRDQELATAQHFLLTELGPMQDPTVTKILIDLASDARISPLLLDDAAKLLATRRNGAEYMIEALGRHYDFLSDVLRPPPIGPMADALAAMRELRAAPLLAKHLNDPANAPDDIKRCARALVELAGPAEAEELKTFFALYRATADEPALVEAVLAAAEALLRVGGDSAREVVTAAIADPLTQPEIKRGLENLTQTHGAESPRSAPTKG